MSPRSLFHVLHALACVLPAAAALADVPTNLPEEAPFTFGRVQLYPVYGMDLGWSDNFYYRPEDGNRISTWYSTLSPGLVVDLPFSQSHARVGYVASYWDYAADGIEGHLDHFFRGEATFDFASGFWLSVEDSFQRGVLNVEVFDPGGGTRFQGETLQANSFEVSGRYSRSESWEFDISVRQGNIEFIERTAGSGHYDVDEQGATLGVWKRVGPAVRLFLGFDWSDAFLSRPVPPDERTDVEQGWSVGGSWILGSRDSLSFTVGLDKYETQSELDPEEPPERSRTMSASASYARRVPGRMSLTFDLLRGVYPAISANNRTYVATRIDTTIGNDPAARLVLNGRMTYYTNLYPEPFEITPTETATRKDRTLEVEVSAGYRFTRFLVVRSWAKSSRRASILPTFEWNVLAAGVTLGFGM